MRKPKYHQRELGEKLENARYHPVNESRDAYGNFKRQYRSKVDSELSPPARSRVPRYQVPRSEYREQSANENKPEMQTHELATETSKLSDHVTEVHNQIEKSRQELRELQDLIRADSRTFDEKLVALGIEKKVQKIVADFLGTDHEPESLMAGQEQRNVEPHNQHKEEERSGTESTLSIETEKENNSEQPFTTNELTEEEAEALINGIEESGFVDNEKVESREQNAQPLEQVTETEIQQSRAKQPSEVLDKLEQEMDYLEDHLSKATTDTDPLPDLIGDLFHAEKLMNDAKDSLERVEPVEPVEDLPYEESGE